MRKYDGDEGRVYDNMGIRWLPSPSKKLMEDVFSFTLPFKKMKDEGGDGELMMELDFQRNEKRGIMTCASILKGRSELSPTSNFFW